jgi:hypothetical protein
MSTTDPWGNPIPAPSATDLSRPTPDSSRNEGTATGALVGGILALLCGVAGGAGVVIGPVAVVLGLTARRRIRQAPGALKGDGLAVAGIVMGIVGAVISIVWILVLVANPDLVEEIRDRLTTTTTTMP